MWVPAFAGMVFEGMTRLFQQPKQITVRVNDSGEPLAITRGRKSEQVKHISRRWRVSDGWWRQEVAREYFHLETSSGLVCEIYRDMLSGSWYLHRIYD